MAVLDKARSIAASADDEGLAKGQRNVRRSALLCTFSVVAFLLAAVWSPWRLECALTALITMPFGLLWWNLYGVFSDEILKRKKVDYR